MMRSAGRVAVPAGLALIFAIAVNLLVARYILAERVIYSWDAAGYWLVFQDLSAALRSDFLAGLVEIKRSIAEDDYNVLPALPLLPFEAAFGPGRLSYILAITNVAMLPSAALLALVVERAMGARSWLRWAICAAAVLGIHVLWGPVVRGLPDVLGVLIAACILLVYFGDREGRSFKRMAAVGFLLGVLILTRRYYVFWVISFFPAALAGYAFTLRKAHFSRPELTRVVVGLAVSGGVCTAALLVFARPFLLRVASTSYSSAYSVYRPEIAGRGALGQIVDHFGTSLLALCSGGLIWLAIRIETRCLGILLIVQAVISILIFSNVQALIAPHHFYLLGPAAGIGVAAAVAGFWNANLATGWRTVGIVGSLFVVVLNSGSTFFTAAPIPLTSQKKFPPEFRSDLDEMKRLMTTLASLDGEKIYVAASSGNLNWSIFKTGCRTMQPELCHKMVSSADIDLRDGFPTNIVNADLVVVGTPTQYHVLPEGQQVVGLVAQEIREGRGIGRPFERLPYDFRLSDGVNVAIFQRIAPPSFAAMKELAAKLQHNYPGAERLFEPPPPCEDPFSSDEVHCTIYAD